MRHAQALDEAKQRIVNLSLKELDLVDTHTPHSFANLTRLAARSLRTPVALVSIVEEEKDRQYFTSQLGLPEPWATVRQTPLSHSFCKYVKQGGQPLVVANARKHPLVCDNPAIRDLNVEAYLGVPITGSDGSVLGALCVIDKCPRDWTENDVDALSDLARCVSDEILLRAALLTNKIRQQRLDLTIQASGDGIWDWDIESGALSCSERLTKILGFRPERSPRHFTSFLGRVELECHKPLLIALNEHLTERAPFEIQIRLKHTQGHWIDVSVKGQAAWNNEGHPVRMVGTVSDISELVRSNDLLLQTERLASIGHWHYTFSDRKLNWSPEAYRIHDLEPFELVPSIDEMISRYHIDDRELVKAAVVDAIHVGKDFSYEARIIHSSGKIRHVHCHAKISTGPAGEPVEFLGSVQDRTEFVERERQLNQAQKMEAFGQLAGGVAHDFNNLLAVILGNVELLDEEDDPSARFELSHAAIDAVLRGRDLTESLLSFARTAPLQPKRLELNEVFTKLSTIIRRTLPANQEVLLDFPENLWPVKADLSNLESCIVNLVLNARDSMPQGGSLKFSASNIQAEDPGVLSDYDLEVGPYVVLEVSDTGSGISEADLGRVFEPFFTTKDVGKGSGLGLSRVRGFAEQSGGSVGIKSKVGFGTTVRMILPTFVLDNSFDDLTYPSTCLDGIPCTRILLVEDMEDVRTTIERRLKSDGYDVVTSGSGDSAYALFTQDKDFDVLITDIVMPGRLQGTDLVSKIRALKPGIGVIYLSGHTRNPLEGAQTDDSAVFLTKPVAKSALYTALDGIIDLSVANHVTD